jgi:hypothetical protein
MSDTKRESTGTMSKKDEEAFRKKVREQENRREPANPPSNLRNFKAGGRVNTRRENRLEELGRVDAEKAYTKKGKRNLKAEKKRIVREVSSRGAAKRGHGKEIK